MNQNGLSDARRLGVRLYSLLFSALILFGFSSANAEAAVICSNEPIPQGHAVVSVQPTTQCSTQLSYTTEPLRAPMTICSVVGVPTGYVVTQSLVSAATCNSFLRYDIDLPSPGRHICAEGALPSGYIVFTIQSVSPQCFRVPLYQIQLPSNVNSMCSVTRVPNGYAAISTATDLVDCNGYYRSSIRTVTSPMSTCAVDGLGILPKDYVVTQLSSTASCSIFALQHIVKVNGESRSMCAVTPLPQGYEIQSDMGYTASCTFAGTAYKQYFIRKIPTAAATASFTSRIVQTYNGFLGPIYVVEFTATTTFPANTALTYQWNFGNGATQTVQGRNVVTHGYSTSYRTTTPPSYLVTLTVTDGTRTTAPATGYAPYAPKTATTK